MSTYQLKRVCPFCGVIHNMHQKSIECEDFIASFLASYPEEAKHILIDVYDYPECENDDHAQLIEGDLPASKWVEEYHHHDTLVVGDILRFLDKTVKVIDAIYIFNPVVYLRGYTKSMNLSNSKRSISLHNPHVCTWSKHAVHKNYKPFTQIEAPSPSSFLRQCECVWDWNKPLS